jgi:pyrroloquinoline quinone biosynthesis protein B
MRNERVLAILKSNSIFNVLSETNVKRQPIAVDQAFEPELPDGSPSGIEILPVRSSRQGRVVSRGKAHPGRRQWRGDTLGLRILDKTSGKYLYFVAACARVTDDLKARLKGAALVFFDGTVWRERRTGCAGTRHKTGQSMGHISMSGEDGAIESLEGLDIGRERCFSHINNSNPALLHSSDERKTAEHAAGTSPARWNGDHAVSVVPVTRMTALSIGKGISLNNAEELEATLRHIGATRYHNLHPFPPAAASAASSTRARCRPGR